jgi:hypothetical protein
MDPIHPITPGPPSIGPAGGGPVERLKPISRERDRPARERPQRERRRPPRPEHGEHGGDDGEGPHIDVRA